jgi:uncharacterized repeat protein (TIGR01451 family)
MVAKRIAAPWLALIGIILSLLFWGGEASAADLQVTNYTSNADPVGASAEVTFTATVTNNSIPSVANAVLTIAVSDRFEVVDATTSFPSYCAVSGSAGAQVLTCNLPTLNGGGASNARSVTYKAIARNVGSSGTTASIAASGNTDSNAGNNALTITPTVRNGVDLSLSKSASASSIIAGGTLQYVLTVSNSAGPHTTSAVRVVDNLPATTDFQFQSVTGTNWTCSRSGTTVTCNYSGAAPASGSSYPAITITGKIVKATAGTVSNLAAVSITDALVLDPNSANNTSNTVVTQVTAGSDLQALTSIPSPIIVGNDATLGLTITNLGPQALPAGATITATLPSVLTPVQISSACSLSGQTVTCTSAALAVSGQAAFNIKVNANSATTTTVGLTATIAPPAGYGDPVLSNNTATVSFQTVPPNADLSLYRKLKAPSPVAPGAKITTTITVRNVGPSVASWTPTSPIRVTDTLSADESFADADGNWACTVAGSVVTCQTTDSGTLAVGADKVLVIRTIAGPGTDTTVTSTACTDRTANSAHTPSIASSPTANDCLSAGARSTTMSADLSIQKDVSLSSSGDWSENLAIGASDSVFYLRLRVSNAAGGDTARTVVVTDRISNFINASGFVTAVTRESGAAGTLSYTSSSGQIVWNLTNLAAGATETLVLRVQRPFESGGPFANAAEVLSPDTLEINDADNKDSAQYTVAPIADMLVSGLSVEPDPARVGVPATYVISLRNAGANPASNVQMIDVFDPARFEIVGTPTTTKSGATCSLDTPIGTVTCNMGQFTRTQAFQVNVNVLPKYPFGAATMASLPATYVNRASVTTSTQDSNGGSDPAAGNNFLDFSHSLQAPRFDLAVTKTESNPATDDPIGFGETLNYDIRASNYGPSRATDILVTDIPAPPAGMTMTLSSVQVNPPVGATGGLSLQAAPSGGCTASGANYVCKVHQTDAGQNYLDPLKQVVFRLVFTSTGVSPSSSITFANAAEITAAEQPVWNGSGADFATGNNRVVQTTTMLPSTDLDLVSKTRGGALVRDVNEPIEYTIRFRNLGPSTARRVRVSDALPAGFVYVATPSPSTTIPGGSAATVSTVSCSGTRAIVCDLEGSFPVGAGNTVDLVFHAKAEAPYAGAFAPDDARNTATITPGLDGDGQPLSEDPAAGNNSQSASVQIQASSIAGTVYGDDNDSGSIDSGEGIADVTLTLSGIDLYGNKISATTTTGKDGTYRFAALPPSDAAGYTIVETQPATHYDRHEIAGRFGGRVNDGVFGDGAAENTISEIVLPPKTDATDYIFQDHIKAAILAEDDAAGPVSGGAGNTRAAEAFANDTWNGAALDLAKVVVTIVTPAAHAGVTMDPATGVVAVAAGTPAGTYTIDYRLCDKADPTTCDPARVTVTVAAGTLSAANDSVGGINGANGGTNVLAALAGDTLNGVAVTSADVTIALASGAAVPAGLTFDPATGNTSVAAGTPAGTYSFDYRICEKLNPANCASATEAVTVIAAPIAAAADSHGGMNGAAGASNVLNVLTGDTLNGAAATIATVSAAVAAGASVPAGLVFDTATGQVSVQAGTPAGSYTFDYAICEKLNPSNCAVAAVTVTVVSGVIAATDDSQGGIDGETGRPGALNVLTGDTLNGSPATIGNVTITLAPGATVPAQLHFDLATGDLSVAPNTPAAIYAFDYRICEKLNAANCASAKAAVTVVAASITATDDTAGGIDGGAGASNVLGVLSGDTLGTAAATTARVSIALAAGSALPAGLAFDTATGNVSVASGTAAGSYTFNYSICQKLNPANCASAKVTVTVTAGPIAAADDSLTGVNGAAGASSALNVLTGDTLNDAAATTGTVVIALASGSTVPAGLTFDTATGNVAVSAGTAAGTYTFDYRICEKINPSNCAGARVSVTVVAAAITAADDSRAGINGAAGASNALNVLNGDTLNGSPATAANVSIALAAGSSVPANLSFDTATGAVSVAPGTPAGAYAFRYTICETLNPANCASAAVSITVVAGPITAADDAASGVQGAAGAPDVLNVLGGDSLNGGAATSANVLIALDAGSSVPVGLSFDTATGSVSVAAGTANGAYSFRYRICERINPANCAAAEVSVTVTAAPIAAADDNVGGINGGPGASNVLNILSGDTLGGAAASSGNVTIALAAGSAVPAGLTFDPAAGNVSVPPGTPAGSYSFNYTICEKLNPSNCASARVTVTVVAGSITADDDQAAPINGANGAAAVVDAIPGDTLNGAQAALSDLTLTVTGPAVSIGGGPVPALGANGLVDVPSATPAGSYVIAYRICERLNPSNCANATITVPVTAAPIAAVGDSRDNVDGAAGLGAALSVLGNDSLNGAAATAAGVTLSLAAGSSLPSPLAFDLATGNVSVSANTPAGSYSFSYTICEKLNPANCASAPVTITVAAGPISATDDTAPATNGTSGGADVADILPNDRLNGAAPALGAVTITVVTPASSVGGAPIPVLNPADGKVDVPAGTPAGSYAILYRICERLNPSNCASATVSVPVSAAAIVATADQVAGVAGAAGAANVLNVLNGDTLNGSPATAANVSIALAAGSSVPANLSFDPATGSVSVSPGTPAGDYGFAYMICEKINPANCAQANVSVEVSAGAITAIDDSAGGVNGAVGASDVLNVLGGDTLNGAPASAASVTIAIAAGSTLPSGLAFDPASGRVSVPAGTSAGTYSFAYTICEKLNPANCASARASVTVVSAPIMATDDRVGAVHGIVGAARALNVLAGDSVNGAPATIDTVTIALAPGAAVPAGLTFDPASGNVTVAPSTPAGSYAFDYTICEKLNPLNCASAKAVVQVDAAAIAAAADTSASLVGDVGGAAVTNVLANDSLDGAPATLAAVTIAVTSPAAPAGTAPVPVLEPATGSVTVPAGTPAGSYAIGYRICEKLNPGNCAEATISVAVTAASIVARDDSAVDVSGAEGAANVLNVLDGDTLSGAPATPAGVTIAVFSASRLPNGFTLDLATGALTVAPGTPAGAYSFAYQICEKINPANCAGANVSVTVAAAKIVAVPDTAGEINGVLGVKAVVSAFLGDTLNGAAASAANTTLALAPGMTLPSGIGFDTATGDVSVAPGTKDGSYRFDYLLCERLNPANCASATITLTVLPPRSTLSGVVYLDDNMNRSHETGERALESWLVEVMRGDEVAGSTRTDAQGAYTVTNLLSGGDYTVVFRNPVNNVVYGRIEHAALPAGGALLDQNLPIDPSGVIYDSITRQPVAGARVRLTGAGGVGLPAACFIDPSQMSQVTGRDGFYRFDILSGAAAQCPGVRSEYRLEVTAPANYANPVSTVLPAREGAFNAAGRGNPIAIVPSASAPQAGDPAIYYLAFLLAPGDGNILNNHVPIDPFLSRTPLLVTKTSDRRTASTGDLVSYTITVRNTESAARAGLRIVDILPPGFKYVPGSARMGDVAAEPQVADRELRWAGQTLVGNATATYRIVTVVGAGVTQGDRINTAVARDGLSDTEVSNRAQAVVSIVPSAVFDCAEIIGKVFEDLNGDGVQDDGEPGIPAARLATVNGQLVTADEQGRYHITCAAVPDAQIGSNFVLKLDTRTIPAGYAPTSDNPQSIRLTRGKVSKLNFGLAKVRALAVTLDARAFEVGTADLRPSFAGRLAGLKAVAPQRLIVRLTYSPASGEDAELAKARLASIAQEVAATFRSGWSGPAPTIEADIVHAAPAAGQE